MRIPISRTVSVRKEWKRLCSSQSSRVPVSLDKESVYDNYEDVLKFARSDPDAFWGEIGRTRLKWRKEFTQVNNCDLGEGNISWYTDGQLNISENCLDFKPRDEVALIWEKDEPATHESYTYGQMLELTCQIANTLKGLGVEKGDRVVIYLPTSPVAVATMMACARIGAIHCVVFAGFSATALAQRVNAADAKVIVTADKTPRGGKLIELKKIVDEAMTQCHTVQNVLVWQRTEQNELKSNELDLLKMCDQVDKFCEATTMNSDDPLFMLHTSGSTGKPKGLVHSNGGYSAYAAWTHEVVFDWNKGDIFACVADIGWVTGHNFCAYGALINGVTSVLFESTPLYPDPGRYWEMVERLKVNQFYAAPTALRSLIKAGDHYPQKYDLSSLKTLGTVGEPINSEAWSWYNSVIGKSRCTIVDTWWQTETGGVMIAPRPSKRDAEIIPTMAMRALPGIEVVLVDPVTKQDIPKDEAAVGDMYIKKPWPGMASTIWKEHQRYLDTYISREKPGYYLTGDEVQQTEKNYLRILGRMDDVINISGHRLGTSEVENVINMHHDVSESAVIGVPHELKGEALHAFVILKDGIQKSQEQILTEILENIKTEIASFAKPEQIVFTEALPKTRSGKIMRRILKKVAVGVTDDLGDTSTLADPSAVASILKAMGK